MFPNDPRGQVTIKIKEIRTDKSLLVEVVESSEFWNREFFGPPPLLRGMKIGASFVMEYRKDADGNEWWIPKNEENICCFVLELFEGKKVFDFYK